ncbi:Alpha/Beta hydrolase protein [Cyathus striatus]|nr:Alpha/Beta hydrolase protein [Cyathus striatus]
MINKPNTNARALTSCKQLSETLLRTNGTFFESDMKSLLSYLSLETFNPLQQFWVLSNSSKSCSAISLLGSIQKCTAPPEYADGSEPAVPSGSSMEGLNAARDSRPPIIPFIGIPYADPFERFAYSKAFSSSASLSALKYGLACLQWGGGCESCLFLSIYTPSLPIYAAASKKELKLVLFWIHGKSLTGGVSSESNCDGGNMASRNDIVVVTINYRLGTLGFLALEDGVANGNFGIADQVHNSPATGARLKRTSPTSDPCNDIRPIRRSSRLLAAKSISGLFAGAIAQSNLGDFGVATTYSEYMSIQDQFTQFAQPTIGFIVADGKFITTDHLVLTGKCSAVHVPAIFGWMRDNGTVPIKAFPSATTTETQELLGAG